jgi:Spy/CpxP family protein refolding chaperone
VLIGTAATTRFFVKERIERVTGAGYIQLVPRKFLADLPRERRRELLAVFGEFRDEFRDGRKASRETAAKLADVLEAEPYDAAAVKAVADEFSQSGRGLIDHGVEAAVQFVGKLTPEERRQLALRIRERAAAGRRN